MPDAISERLAIYISGKRSELPEELVTEVSQNAKGIGCEEILLVFLKRPQLPSNLRL
ncbi:MAG TPA: hypothetical protein VJ801_01150 [Polyangia bacterium]|nr:hypothetical protein [Polyangia bacterium]